ncbi:MAG: hypothetical protein KDH09_18670, partial [Chrysiogenetes bacterium]|nr:hypothetical protein [Chrysiogenetes bacterium]
MEPDYKMYITLSNEIDLLYRELDKVEARRAELVSKLRQKERERGRTVTEAFNTILLKEQAHKAKTTPSRVGEREGTRPYQIVAFLEAAPDRAFTVREIAEGIGIQEEKDHKFLRLRGD